jgi:ubiquinone/menaquinone biosynthesis C-methylase UbiE
MRMPHRARASMLGVFDHADLYDRIASRLLRRLYREVAADVSAVGLSPDARLLDVGAGPGRVALLIASDRSGPRVDGVDLSARMVARARSNAALSGLGDRAVFTEGDVAALPYPDAVFDLVVSTMSQHHWPDADAGMRELRRVLRPTGEVWIYDLRVSLRRAEAAARARFPGCAVGGDTLRAGPLLRRLVGRLVVRPS